MDEENKAILIKLLTFLSLQPSIEYASYVEYLHRELDSTKSKEIRIVIIENLCQLIKAKNLNNKILLEKCRSYLKKNLHDTLMMITLLRVFSQICHVRDSKEMEEMFSEFSVDANDARVRKTGYECLINLQTRGFTLSHSLYQKCAIVGLQDSFEEVRSNAMKLVWILGTIYRDELISIPNKKKPVKMSDDAFIKICKSVSDWSVSCRTQASLFLGRFPSISLNLLLQTFDKKLIKVDELGEKGGYGGGNPKNKNFANQRISLDFGEKDKKRKNLDDEHKHFNVVSKYEIDSSEVSITKEDIGAVGAFVHGLEDEFSQVRSASVDSICELSLKNNTFATKAVDFLVDMFNDEIESVRVNSVSSLRKIAEKVTLSEEHFKVVLYLLEDSSQRVRFAIHNLLGCIQQSDALCLSQTVTSMLDSIKRYPEDQNSVFESLVKMGRLHGNFTQFVLEDLLQIDTKFMLTEKHVHDQTYVGYLVLILNSAKVNPNIIQLLPSYAIRHYYYLRDLHPNIFPHLKIEHNDDKIEFDQDFTDSLLVKEHNEENYLDDCFFRISKVSEDIRDGHFENFSHSIDLIEKDLKLVSSLKPSLSAKTKMYSLYLKILTIIIKSKKISAIKTEHVSHLFELTYTIENLFMGLTLQHKMMMKELRVFAHVLYLITTTSSFNNRKSEKKFSENFFNENNNNFINLNDLNNLKNVNFNDNKKNSVDDLFDVDAFPALLERLEDFKSFSLQNSLEISPFVQSILLSFLPNNSSTNIMKAFPLIQNYVPKPIPITNLIKEKRAGIISPITSSNIPILFSPVFPFKIKLEASLENIYHPNTLQILIIFPDDKTRELIYIRTSDLTLKKPLCYHLNKTIVLNTQTSWTESCFLRILIVETFQPDLAQFDSQNNEFVSCLFEEHKPQKKTNSFENISKYNKLGVVSISKEHKCYILPNF
eukprot:TRINITY_DN3302_c0_g1_i1.p1 TRINITY_DN3302_c0_g1~~TRINITY_DN3302_c0_g1_i1.p1  ORF type:complete len:1024 (+),score=285.45 TRINITY_DN3302_c0_g1_i1:266-3073(+)